MIVFGAKLISNTNIQKLGRDKKYHDFNVSFVKFTHEHKNDQNVLMTSELWGLDSYSKYISNNFRNLNYSNNIYGDEFFAITTQKENFENMNPDNILGLMQTSKRCPDNYVEFIQTKPEFKFGETPRTFKNIGKALLNAFFATLGTNKTIHLDTNHESAKFYKKLGFICISNDPDIEEQSLYIKI